MNKKVKYSLFFSVLLFMAVGSGWLVYLGLVGEDNKNRSALQTNVIQSQEYVDGGSNKKDNLRTTNRTIFSFTKLSNNEEIEKVNKLIPEEFIGLDRDALGENYQDWTITSFNPREVKFEKNIVAHKPIYVLSIDNDELVIYYKDDEGNINIEDRTGIFLESLPDADIESIRQGIVYDKKEDIFKVLENFDS